MKSGLGIVILNAIRNQQVLERVDKELVARKRAYQVSYRKLAY